MLRESAATLVRDARLDIGMTQRELAAAAGIHQPTLAAYEAGRRRPSEETLRRILSAARTRPSIPLTIAARDIRSAAARRKLSNVRVFGSVLTGEDTERSDIDLLVRVEPNASLFDLGGFASDVETLTGFPVDVLTEEQASTPRFERVLSEAVPL